ncbi:hypothetical protein [Robiginitalea aurantiaca]|uniref:DUF1211 domain-containing protein n=1 Tax=Robiginitalea aurantiaca TaxID=3056915 RepID=A0ABT7WIN4_9FLAO|nr:hypothetical protein [Robiginitalea aurantiaca]MDM9632723.1 hypothetical protein [Robiginitalea aurantiaca]
MNHELASPESIYLQRLSRFIDVVYALLFFHLIINYLPAFESMDWTHKPLGLLSHLIDNRSELLRIFIGGGLALLYWNQNNNLFKNLVKTDGKHALLSLVQLFLVVLFVYFAIADPGLESQSSPALQAGCLALAGFTSIGTWLYAAKHNLIREGIDKKQVNDIAKDNLMEPLTAVVNVGLAFVGPMVWTLAWFALPPLFVWILKKRK